MITKNKALDSYEIINVSMNTEYFFTHLDQRQSSSAS